jgi:hypothetical protein
MGSWAIEYVRRVEYYELDSSFKTACAYVYAIAMVVQMNAGSLAGIGVTLAERRDAIDLFTAASE